MNTLQGYDDNAVLNLQQFGTGPLIIGTNFMAGEGVIQTGRHIGSTLELDKTTITNMGRPTICVDQADGKLKFVDLDNNNNVRVRIIAFEP